MSYVLSSEGLDCAIILYGYVNGKCDGTEEEDFKNRGGSQLVFRGLLNKVDVHKHPHFSNEQTILKIKKMHVSLLLPMNNM